MADHVWDMSLPRDGEFLSSTVVLETNDPSVPSKTWASDIKPKDSGHEIKTISRLLVCRQVSTLAALRSVALVATGLSG
jgi:hypothetical protein